MRRRRSANTTADEDNIADDDDDDISDEDELTADDFAKLNESLKFPSAAGDGGADSGEKFSESLSLFQSLQVKFD